MVENGNSRAFVVQWVRECPGVLGSTCPQSETDARRFTTRDGEPHIMKQVTTNLGRHVAAMFPIDPSWNPPRARFFMAKSLTESMQSTMVTA